MGKTPGPDHLKKFSQSKHYSTSDNKFKNQYIDALADVRKNSISIKSIYKWINPGVKTKPGKSLPFEVPNFKNFQDNADNIHAIWFGHSTVLINLAQLNILIDPVFAKTASPLPFLFERFQPPIVSLDELPNIDVVVISHDHYDHLDMTTVQHFAGTETLFVVPLGVDSHLTYWGISPEKIIALDWWEYSNIKNVQFVATPAQHYSGRNGIDTNKTLWASWVIKTNTKSIYYSGDSGFGEHFKTIGQNFGPFDVSFIETGQYDKAWEAIHLLPEQSASAGYYLNTKVHFPVHWGMFDLSSHAWNDPIQQITRHCLKHDFQLIEPYLGKIYSF